MIDLRNCDCMDLMREFPDNHFDLAIVDPPYGVGGVGYAPGERNKASGGFIDKYEVTLAVIDYNQRRKNKTDVVHNRNGAKTISNFGDENVSPSPKYFSELFRVSKRQIVWGGNYFVLPPSRGFIVWEKTTVSESFSMAMCEYAWISMNENAKIFKGAPQGTSVDPRVHPTQKPVALYRWLLHNYAKPGDKILDTHLGSGSIAIACHEKGFDLTGSELDPDYFAAMQKRLKTAFAQQDIFAKDAE